MRVAFYYHSAPNKDSIEFFDWMMGAAVESVRKHMPNSVIWHLKGPSVERRNDVDESLELRDMHRAEHCALLGAGDTLFLDIDVIVQGDVSSVFDSPFDIALAVRPKKDAADWKRIPYNGGAIFSRCPAFWRGLDAMVRTENYPQSDVPLNRYIGTSSHAVLNLSDRYNHAPQSLDEDLTGQAIVHWKGEKRKRWMRERYDPEHAERILEGV